MPFKNATPLNRSQYRILVVDDERNVRSALQKALTLHGYNAESAASGEEALKMLQDSTFSLMVLDMHMPPGINGITVMQRTREIQPHLLILVLTAHPSVDNAIAAVKSRAVDFLQKPVSTRALCDTVDRLLHDHAGRLHKEMLADAIADVVNTLRVPEIPDINDATSEHTDESEILYVPPLTLNRIYKTVTVDGSSVAVSISTGESILLAYMMTHPNQLLTSRQLAHCLLGDGDLSEGEAQKLVRPYLSRLRAKLPVLKSTPPVLRTIRGRGYMFQPKALV